MDYNYGIQMNAGLKGEKEKKNMAEKTEAGDKGLKREERGNYVYMKLTGCVCTAFLFRKGKWIHNS